MNHGIVGTRGKIRHSTIFIAAEILAPSTVTKQDIAMHSPAIIGCFERGQLHFHTRGCGLEIGLNC
ncbi:hypothetical protein SDC9_158408 [bioreactor metagenome]|uniref:Uncharacterized protein n=1 Tax=bioreactor metagenome TaxID=1076179 RepID=A0A645FA33_9ZZZZ